MSKRAAKYFHLFICFITILFSLNSTAQNRGTIKGTVNDRHNPIEFVNVILYSPNDSIKALKVVTTDSAGKYVMGDVIFGDYVLKFQVIGFVSSKLKLKLQESQNEIPVIELQPDSKMLDGVEVVSPKNLIKKTTQGFIINAKDNLTSATGTATDLLKNTPTVVV
ncbi:MAG TPA: carboxypeptidase-like regulatory domain-containing protein, partial [Bacteroidia bacterium]|nr:carboxypeptidase-like regulatory domain-containing protein [Bacteroidia bacterium]